MAAATTTPTASGRRTGTPAVFPPLSIVAAMALIAALTLLTSPYRCAPAPAFFGSMATTAALAFSSPPSSLHHHHHHLHCLHPRYHRNGHRHHPRGRCPPPSASLPLPPPPPLFLAPRRGASVGVGGRAVLGMSSKGDDPTATSVPGEMDEMRPKIMAAPTGIGSTTELNAGTASEDPSSPDPSSSEDSSSAAAATATINERLMAEVERDLARQLSSGGTPTTTSGNKAVKTIGRIFTSPGEERTDEERAVALREARDLNGVNPLVAIGSSLFAFGFAVAWWYATTWLSGQFASHPLSVDAAVPVQRLAGVFRNVVVGITTLASGFAGVTGVGLLLLGLRVGYGVYVTGDLDPTPIRTRSVKGPGGFDFGDDGDGDGDDGDDGAGVTGIAGRDKKGGIELPNAWDLMTGKKKPGSRRRR